MSAVPQEFMDSARSGVRSFVVLVRVSPRDPATLVPTDVFLSSAYCTTPPGATSGEPARYWKPLLVDAASISAPGAFVETDLGLCSTTLTVERSALEPADMLLDNAAVSIWLWDSTASDFDKGSAPMLVNASVLSWDCDADKVVLHVRQRTDWNRDLVPIEVTPEAYPQAPEDSIGQRIPIVYGRVSDIPFRPPWPKFPDVARVAGASSDTTYLPLLLGGRRAGAAVLVDTGRGAGAVTNPKARVLVASHKCKTVSALANGCGLYMKQGDKLIPLEPVDPVNDVFNTPTGAGVFIPDNASLAWVSVLPTDVDVVANSAENPRAVLDPYNDTNWARLDWTAGYKTCRMKLQSLDDKLGEATEVYVFVGYRSLANVNLKLRFRNVATGVTFDMALPASATRKVMMARVQQGWIAPAPTTPWALSEIELEAGWPTSTPVITGSGTGEIFFAGISVRFKPRQSVIASERVFEHTETRPITRRPRRGHPPGGDDTIWAPYTVRETIPATTELSGKFFANVEGYADDGEVAAAGEFTGTASALIERAPDVLAHMLVRYGGEALSNIERGVGAFGSFVDARALLQDPRKHDMAYALSVGQTSDVMTAIAWMAQASVSQVVLDRFTDTWRMLPWRADKAVDYGWTFRPQDIVEGTSVGVERTPSNRVVTGLSLGYGYDAASKQFQHKTRIGWDGSSSGFRYRGLRDEYLTVVSGANDRLDFTTTLQVTANLSVGAYDGPGFATMLDASMKAANPAQDFLVAWGPTIINGYNDQLFYNDGLTSTDRTVTIPEGRYASFEALCAAVSAAVDAANGMAPTNFIYSRATRKVTCSRTLGSLWLYLGTGSLRSRRLYATLGWTTTGTLTLGGATTQTSTYERQEETFAIGCIGNALDLNWETGANGLKGAKRNCASLCGFQTLRDSLGLGVQRSWLADCPKDDGEALLLQTAQRYGARRDTIEDLRAVADTDTAREVRNRLAALLGKPRVIITFSTEKAHDIERGRVIALSGDFDAIRPYPDPDSDRSWVGKRFVVVETEQMLGPVAFYTKLRAVALD